jgi:hypothetical protein
MRRRGPIAERFDSLWVGVPESGCWLWTGNQHFSGYGLIAGTESGKRLRAHRVSFEIHNAPIPDGMFVLHKCDVRLCVNPTHLFLGTQPENMADMVRKRRFNSKLNADNVSYIRNSGKPAGELYPMFGVSRETINRVIARSTWR